MMAANSKRAGRPHASLHIAKDILDVMAMHARPASPKVWTCMRVLFGNVYVCRHGYVYDVGSGENKKCVIS